jgi:hypothetical protein
VPADNVYLEVLLIEFDVIARGTLGAQPNHFLLDVWRQSPRLRIRNGQSVDLARTQAFELGSAIGICALSDLRQSHTF